MPNEQEPVLQNANDVSTIISDIQYPALRSVRQSTGRDRTDDEGHELTRWTEKSVMTGWQEEDDWPTLREGENTIIMKLNISSISNHKNTVIWTYLSVIPMYDGPPPKIHVIILQTNKLDSI